MKPNQYIQAGGLISSCLVGANAYGIHSTEQEFSASHLEEITDQIRQRPGHCYMRVMPCTEERELWMVPFAMGEEKFFQFRSVIEHVQREALGKEHFYFPFDLVQENGQTAYLIHPIARRRFEPIRKFLPDAYAERWKLAVSLFHRVMELKNMGLTSNGISREQMRVCTKTHEVKLWLNETLNFVEGSMKMEAILRHEGFFSLPTATEEHCTKLKIPINGTKRDVFSAAVTAFYLIMYTHPFVGSGFDGILREDYLNHYHHFPLYVMMGDSQNDLGNQMFGRVVQAQWKRTVPQLKDLFDRIFKSVTDPQSYWKGNDSCWDPKVWIEALEQDALENDNEDSHSEFRFVNEQYHLA
ncbi:MAG: hypothetical protein IKM59_04065 [Oscillospiraceae bacterium]|nr:hypothetical protein [Oscillospiraceae bacterium]